MSSLNSSDPLDVLRGGDLPVRPDPEFATRLRTRLEAALRLPPGTQGVQMSGTDTALTELTAQPDSPTPNPRAAAVPYLAVGDARRALQWYTAAFGAVVIGDPIVMPDNRIGHAELAIGGGVLYLADEYPELGLRAPGPDAVSISLMLYVDDTDAALARAVAHDATVLREVAEEHGMRGATIIDPFGHRWMLSGPMRGVAVPIQHGDVGYVSLWTPDATRAAAFYHHVLGWTYDPVTRQVTNTREPIGIVEQADRHDLFCCYAVADLATTRQAILDAGGQVGQTHQRPTGPVLDAARPDGVPFAVFEPSAGIARPELNGSGPGELSYITYYVVDSAATRSFYGRVLNWQFEPGRVDDGWGVQNTHPMSGLAGGATESTTVPMWTVANIDEAVARVRQAGGTVLQEPTVQDYGLMAECTDDQGGRFYLGQF